MGALRIVDFSGAVPVLGDRALPDNFAVLSVNTRLYNKELGGIRPPENVIACNGTTKRVFRIPKRTVGGDPANPSLIPPPSYLGDSVWVQFTDKNTDIVKGQLVEDSFERWYFCSPTTGPQFNTYARLLAGLSMYKLGVPGPDVILPSSDIPTISSITGGTAPVVTRAFVFTWVNQYGEESNPSLPVLGSGNANGVWNIASITDPGAAVGYPTYDHKNLYRTITGASGQTTYYKVAEIPIGTTTYADNGAVMTDAILANNLTLQSTGWDLPPADLEGFVAMPNGYLIGWAKNNIYFSESFHFHAWPPAYKQASEYRVVGLGVLAQTCVVCTEGFPATITGTKPNIASFNKATTGEPALSRGSIVSTPTGVIYASQNGLILVGPGGINNVTQGIITREQWIKNYAPQYLRAVRFQNGYLALRDLPTGNKSMFFVDPSDLKVALTEFSEFSSCQGLDVDVWSGEVFVLQSSFIKRWDPPSSDMFPVQWKSKEFQLPKPDNFGCYALWWDDARYASNAFGTSFIGSTDKARVIVYADRVAIYDQVVPRNGQGVRLPSGFKSAIWQFEIRARAPVYALHVASTMRELQNV